MLIYEPTAVLPINVKGQDYIVGDLHGQDDMLQVLLNTVSFDKDKDRLIAVGDLIDRGPGSVRLLEMLQSEPWFYSVKGNHEMAMLYDDMREEDRHWIALGGYETIKQMYEQRERGIDYYALLDGMPHALEVPLADGRRVGVIHAELPLHQTWTEVINGRVPLDSESDIFECRERAKAAMAALHSLEAAEPPPELEAKIIEQLVPVAGIDLLISGHTPLSSRAPIAVENMLFIDTGACYDKDESDRTQA